MFQLFLEAAGQVAVAAVLLGAGLPTLFALGVRSLALAEGAGVGGARRRSAATRRALAIFCFALVLCAVALALMLIVAAGFGKELSFEHIYPTVVDKS